MNPERKIKQIMRQKMVGFVNTRQTDFNRPGELRNEERRREIEREKG